MRLLGRIVVSPHCHERRVALKYPLCRTCEIGAADMVDDWRLARDESGFNNMGLSHIRSCLFRVEALGRRPKR